MPTLDIKSYVIAFLFLVIIIGGIIYNIEIEVLEHEKKDAKDQMEELRVKSDMQNDKVDAMQRETEAKDARLKQVEDAIRERSLKQKAFLNKYSNADIPEGCEDAVQASIYQAQILAAKGLK